MIFLSKASFKYSARPPWVFLDQWFAPISPIAQTAFFSTLLGKTIQLQGSAHIENKNLAFPPIHLYQNERRDPRGDDAPRGLATGPFSHRNIQPIFSQRGCSPLFTSAQCFQKTNPPQMIKEGFKDPFPLFSEGGQSQKYDFRTIKTKLLQELV